MHVAHVAPLHPLRHTHAHVGLLPLTVLWAGCATTSPPSMPVECPQMPSLPPSLARPAPPENFLERAQRDIEEWRSKLKGSPTR